MMDLHTLQGGGGYSWREICVWFRMDVHTVEHWFSMCLHPKGVCVCAGGGIGLLERFCPIWRYTIDHISGLLTLTSSLHTGVIVVLLNFSFQLGWL